MVERMAHITIIKSKHYSVKAANTTKGTFCIMTALVPTRDKHVEYAGINFGNNK